MDKRFYYTYNSYNSSSIGAPLYHQDRMGTKEEVLSHITSVCEQFPEKIGRYKVIEVHTPVLMTKVEVTI